MEDLTKLQPRRNFVRIVTFDKFVAFAKLVNFLSPFQPSHMYSLVHNFVEISRLTNFAKLVKIVHKMWSNLPFSFLHAFLDTSTMNGKNVTWYHTLAPIILKRQKFDSSSLHDSFQLRKNLLSWTFLKMFLRRIMRCIRWNVKAEKA